MYPKIVQLIPAQPGWEAVYKSDDDGSEMPTPVAMWALVEQEPDKMDETPHSEWDGIEASCFGHETCRSTPNFWFFRHESEKRKN